MSGHEDSAAGRVVAELGDLLAVAGVAVIAAVGILSGVVDGPVRVLFAAVLLGFLPGYAVVSALLPRTTPLPWTDGTHPRWRHRAALGVATSVVVLVLAGVALSPTGFATSTVVGTALVITAVGCLLGAVRRLRAPPIERPRLPVATLRADAREVTAGSRVDAVLTVALAAVVVVAVATLAVGLAAPDRGEAYSEAALVTADGEQTAVGNDSYVRGEEATLTLEVENQDNARRNFAVVVVLERFADPPESGDTAAIPAMLERAELTRTTFSLADGETTTQPLRFTPSLLGDDLRLSFYVYAGEAPERPSAESADRHLYRWIDVTDGAANETAALAPPGTVWAASAPSGAKGVVPSATEG